MNVYEYLILKRQMMYKHYIFETNDNGGVMVIILASSTVDRRFIGGVMVIVLASSTVDRRFIGGVMVIILASSTVDRRFIGGVMVIVLASSTVDRRFKLQTDQTKDYKISICCSSAKHAHH